MWLEHCLLWRTSERHFMCGPQHKAIWIHCSSWYTATLKTHRFVQITNIYNPSMLEWFASLVFFWGCVGRFIHSWRKSNTYSFLIGKIRRSKASTDPLRRTWDVCHSSTTWRIGVRGLATVPWCGDWDFKGHPPLFKEKPSISIIQNGKKGPTGFWSWSSVKTSQILPPPNLLGQTFGCWGNAFGCLDCHRVESGCLELWPPFTCLSTRCCRPNSAVHWIRYGVGTRLIKSQRLLKRRDIF